MHLYGHPSDMAASPDLYRQAEAAGHEVGLHIHSADQGWDEFLGVYGAEDQTRILREAMDVFGEHMGRPPRTITPGYGSANDHTFPVLEALGFTHGQVSIPTRDLPQCACVWGDSPLDCHYPHRYNRCLVGDVDFVEIPTTLDPQSRMWGGRHPQDLRVELVDAKNHYYTIEKALERQLAAGDEVPVKVIKAVTHNTYEYGEARDFRRQTLEGIIDAARRICGANDCTFTPATLADIASAYRTAVPRPQGGVKLTLDTRGRTPKAGGAKD